MDVGLGDTVPNLVEVSHPTRVAEVASVVLFLFLATGIAVAPWPFTPRLVMVAFALSPVVVLVLGVTLNQRHQKPAPVRVRINADSVDLFVPGPGSSTVQLMVEHVPFASISRVAPPFSKKWALPARIEVDASGRLSRATRAKGERGTWVWCYFLSQENYVRVRSAWEGFKAGKSADPIKAVVSAFSRDPSTWDAP